MNLQKRQLIVAVHFFYPENIQANYRDIYELL